MDLILDKKICTEEQAIQLLTRALEADESMVSIDTESTGEDIRDGRGYAMGISLAYAHRGRKIGFYLPFRHPNTGGHPNLEVQVFLPYVQRLLDHSTIIHHNAKFDIVSLSTLGLATESYRFLDTMILAHLVDENRPFQGKSLEAVGQMYCGRGKAMTPELKNFIKKMGWHMISAPMMNEYAVHDAVLTYDLFQALRPKLKEQNLLPVWKHKEKFIRLMIAIEKNGVSIDTDFCEYMTEIGEARLSEIENELGLNPGSPKQLKKLLIDELGLPEVLNHKTGRPTFDKSAMEKYEETLELWGDHRGNLILEFRGWQKSVSSNYRPYVERLSPDGRLRPNYKLHGTVTGRMSCEMPNLQQIPRSGDKPWNGKLKQAFVPENNDWVLVEVDYSQLEARLNAAYAESKALKEIFADPRRDLFTEMSAELGWTRQETKGFVYSVAYGAGAARISFVFRCSLDEGKRRIEHFYSVYPELRRSSNTAKRLAEHQGWIGLWSGRRRHFLYPESESRKALNSVVQGGAADFVETQMLRLSDAGFNDGVTCRMLLQVHDSVWFEIRRERVAEYVPQIERLMAETPFFDFDVTFKVDAKRMSA